MTDYIYEMVSFLPENVVEDIIATLASRKDDITSSIHDKEFVVDLLKSRLNTIPSWMNEVLKENNILIVEDDREDEKGWIYLDRPFRTDDVEYMNNIKTYFNSTATSKYDMTTLALMYITLRLLMVYLTKHNMIAHKRHRMWYGILLISIDLFNDSLECKYTKAYMDEIVDAVSEFKESYTIVDFVSIKHKTGDLV